jgi:hypothetical protein
VEQLVLYGYIQQLELVRGGDQGRLTNDVSFVGYEHGDFDRFEEEWVESQTWFWMFVSARQCEGLWWIGELIWNMGIEL